MNTQNPFPKNGHTNPQLPLFNCPNSHSGAESNNHSLLLPEAPAKVSNDAAQEARSFGEALRYGGAIKGILTSCPKVVKTRCQDTVVKPFVINGINGKDVHRPAAVLPTFLCQSSHVEIVGNSRNGRGIYDL